MFGMSMLWKFDGDERIFYPCKMLYILSSLLKSIFPELNDNFTLSIRLSFHIAKIKLYLRIHKIYKMKILFFDLLFACINFFDIYINI